MSGFPMDCVFCAIAGGREPAHRLFEDEHFIVLLDIFPLRPAHVLIVAREHAPHLSDLSAAARDALLALAERIGRALRRAGFGVEGINLLLNDGVAADQHVAHLHLHLIPRRRGDLPRLLWRALTRFLPVGRASLQARLQRERELLRTALLRRFEPCELLGMSANVPTDIVFSFTGLMQRGGGTGPHRDGWGIAFYEGRGVRLFQDPLASVDSEVARLVQRFPIKSETVIGHIRQANVGKVGLSNTHPFIRELGGRYWTFAHNGQLADFQPKPGFYRPVGETDSEAAFCDLLNRVRRAFPEPVPVEVLLPVLISACDEYRKKGVFNALISDGDWLFTFCSSKLAYITRRAPFGPARLKDADLTVDFHAETTPDDVVTVIATEPLTDNENWTLQQSGEWVLWWGGEVLAKGRV